MSELSQLPVWNEPYMTATSRVLTTGMLQGVTSNGYLSNNGTYEGRVSSIPLSKEQDAFNKKNDLMRKISIEYENSMLVEVSSQKDIKDVTKTIEENSTKTIRLLEANELLVKARQDMINTAKDEYRKTHPISVDMSEFNNIGFNPVNNTITVTAPSGDNYFHSRYQVADSYKELCQEKMDKINKEKRGIFSKIFTKWNK